MHDDCSISYFLQDRTGSWKQRKGHYADYTVLSFLLTLKFRLSKSSLIFTSKPSKGLFAAIPEEGSMFGLLLMWKQRSKGE